MALRPQALYLLTERRARAGARSEQRPNLTSEASGSESHLQNHREKSHIGDFGALYLRLGGRPPHLCLPMRPRMQKRIIGRTFHLKDTMCLGYTGHSRMRRLSWR